MKEILYPDVQDDKVLLMAFDYCKARKLDIMKRPIQIVPVWDSKAKMYKSTIWPSISEIRTTASRTGQYAGKSEAIFGEEITEKIGEQEVKYPLWCKITVYKVVAGIKCDFTAKLLWKEYFKTKKGGSPNQMWSTRPYAQLEKCTEAAALRSAFPEEIGNDYIGEEAFIKNNDEESKTSQVKEDVELTFDNENPNQKILQPLVSLFDFLIDAIKNIETIEELTVFLKEKQDQLDKLSSEERAEFNSILEAKKKELENE